MLWVSKQEKITSRPGSGGRLPGRRGGRGEQPPPERPGNKEPTRASALWSRQEGMRLAVLGGDYMRLWCQGGRASQGKPWWMEVMATPCPAPSFLPGLLGPPV